MKRLLSIFASAAVVLAWTSAARAQAEVSREYQLKAAFLVKFAQFVEWPADPAQALAPAAETNICLVGNDPFGSALDTIVSLSDSRDDFIAVQRVSEGEFDGCRFLFVGADLAPRLRAVLAKIGTRPVVTVSDIPHFAENGGIIELFLDGRNVRFKINDAEAGQRGIKLSSKLLALAREVIR